MTASGTAAKPRYRCTGELYGCEAPASVKRGEADTHVEALFLEHAHERVAATGTPRKSALDDAQVRLEQAQQRRAKFLRFDLFSTDDDEVEAVAAELQAEVDEAKAAVAEANNAERRSVRYEDVVSGWGKLELNERKRLLAGGVDSITVSRPSVRGTRVPFAERAVVAFND
jgi:hypothetical protein